MTSFTTENFCWLNFQNLIHSCQCCHSFL